MVVISAELVFIKRQWWTRIVTVTASDSDTSLHGTVSFSLVGTDANKYFQVRSQL